ncbi:MAG: acyltransferase family protein, partial [Limisphaerales bacterium]
TRGWLERWHVSPSANKDYDFIDGLRGIAILLVLGCHLIYINPISGPLVHFAGGIFQAGAWGVTVFFTLSGFLISSPFWKRKLANAAQTIPPGYGWRRFWKIYPPLALSVVILTPIYILIFNDLSIIKLAGQWLAGWPFVFPVSSRINPVMWSLIVEVQFYVVLPLLFLCLRRASVRTALWVVLFVFLVIPTGWRWWNLSRGIHLNLDFSPGTKIDVLFPSMLDGFCFGVLIAGLENLRWIGRRWSVLGDLGLGLLVLSLIATSWFTLHPVLAEPAQHEILGWCVKIASAFTLFYLADPQRPLARMLCNPLLRWCGIISYEWYLFHQPVIFFARNLLGPAGGSLLKYGLFLVAAFGVGLAITVVVYKYFSLPILKYGRGRNRPEPKISKQSRPVARPASIKP